MSAEGHALTSGEYIVHHLTHLSTGKPASLVDFSVIKSTLCDWLEEHWDHKFMLWMNDPMLPKLRELSPESVVSVTFNPTAENMALYLLHSVGPHLMAGTGVALLRVKVEETRKCSASAEL